MTTLDPRSLIAMGGFMALVMMIVLASMRRYYPRSILGLGWWAFAPAVWVLATVFFVGPGLLPKPVEGLLANAFLLLGFCVFYVGCRLFVGWPAQWSRPLALLTATMLSMAWYTLADPIYWVRVTIVTLALGLMQIATIVTLWQGGKQRNFPALMVQLTLVFHLVVMVLRVRVVLSDPSITGLLANSSVQILYLGANVLVILLLSIGAVLMATDRVRSELEHTATHDGLTGILNRGAILALCKGEQERSVRYGQAFSLLMLDLDHFKAVNDTYGHQHGDRVLVHFAQCTEAALRSADRLGRYGGEEFLALLPNTVSDAALPLARRIQAALAVGHALDCKVSIGVTHWRGPEDTLDAMLGRADTALYRAKAQGRDQTCIE